MKNNSKSLTIIHLLKAFLYPESAFSPKFGFNSILIVYSESFIPSASSTSFWSTLYITRLALPKWASDSRAPFFFHYQFFFFFFLTLLPNFGSNLFASAYCFLFLHFTIFPGLCVRKNSYDSLRDYIMSTTCVRISCKNWMFIMMARHFSPYLSLSNWLRLSWKYPQSEYSWLQSRLKRLLLYTFPARACSTSFFCYKHWFLGKSGCKFGLPYPYHNIR